EANLPEEGREVDETLRLGLPPLGRWGRKSNLILLGGGAAVALLLALVLWQMLSGPPLKGPDVKPQGQLVVQGDEQKRPDKEPNTPEVIPAEKDKKSAAKVDEEPNPMPETKGKEDIKGKDDNKAPEETPNPPDFPVGAPKTDQVVIAR